MKKNNRKGVVFLIIIVIVIILLISIPVGTTVKNNIDFGDVEGTIVDKQYCKAYSTTVYTMANKVLIPITIYHPETWNFEIEKEKEDKIIRRTINVTKDIYEKLNIGDTYKEDKQ